MLVGLRELPCYFIAKMRVNVWGNLLIILTNIIALTKYYALF